MEWYVLDHGVVSERLRDKPLYPVVVLFPRKETGVRAEMPFVKMGQAEAAVIALSLAYPWRLTEVGNECLEKLG